MARLAPEDPYCGLADPADITRNWPQIELADGAEPSAATMIGWTREAEDAARAVKRHNQFGRVRCRLQPRLGLSRRHSIGFAGGYSRTSISLSASVLAGDGLGMERDYDYESKVFAADMPKPAEIGTRAGEKAVRRLNPRKMPTGQVPVVFDPRIAGSLLGQLSGAISGSAIARGTSFLKDKLGQMIFPETITIIDDPFRPRGLRSRPFDGEGILPQKMKLVDRGVLTTWLLDQRSARQLKLRSTGHALARGGWFAVALRQQPVYGSRQFNSGGADP